MVGKDSSNFSLTGLSNKNKTDERVTKSASPWRSWLESVSSRPDFNDGLVRRLGDPSKEIQVPDSKGFWRARYNCLREILNTLQKDRKQGTRLVFNPPPGIMPYKARVETPENINFRCSTNVQIFQIQFSHL